MTSESISISEPIFIECCAWASPATILLSDNGHELQARFAEYDLEHAMLVFVVHDFGELSSLDDVRLGQHCAVTFGYQNRARLFVSVIREYYRDGDRTLFEIPVPRRVATAEVRGAVRVPVLDALLTVTLLIEGEELLRPRARNLSLTGMLIAFEADTDPELYPYDKVAVELRLGDETVALRGIVRRCEPLAAERRYGLLFPETVTGTIPEGLRRMVEKIEQRWLEENRPADSE